MAKRDWVWMRSDGEYVTLYPLARKPKDHGFGFSQIPISIDDISVDFCVKWLDKLGYGSLLKPGEVKKVRVKLEVIDG